jgi:type IV fimbrial biogenesis protein FimT
VGREYLLDFRQGGSVLIHRHKQHGFTLIETMIGIVIAGLLFSIAMPLFTSMGQNAQVRGSAESILNGLQLARAEAIKLNLNTELAMIDAGTPPNITNVNHVASASGSNWIIRYTNPVTASKVFVQGRSGEEGSRNATVTDLSGTGSFVFSPLGRLITPPAGAQIRVESSVTYGNKRKMCVIVSPGGGVIMCDPNKVDATNPRFCPAGSCP